MEIHRDAMLAAGFIDKATNSCKMVRLIYLLDKKKGYNTRSCLSPKLFPTAFIIFRQAHISWARKYLWPYRPTESVYTL